MPNTLAQAEDWLNPYWPGPEATPKARQVWHELRATVFAHVAETDLRHHHEALALAAIERQTAARFAADKRPLHRSGD